jgi:DNA repair protein RecO (recombination protein O)
MTDATDLPAPPERLRDRLYRTEGIVIRRIDLGEADKILTLFTPRRGKVRVIAKGIRRPESHLGGNLELFVQATVLLARGRDLDIVTQAEIVEPYKGLRTDLVRTQASFYLGELLDGLAADGVPNEPCYALLTDCLAALAAAHSPVAIVRYYEFRLLQQMGFGLEVMRCVACRRPLEPGDNAVSIGHGGILCPACHAVDPTARAISVGALKVLRLIRQRPLAALLAVRLPPGIVTELDAIARAWVREHLEYEPRSWALLAAALRDDD